MLTNAERMRSYLAMIEAGQHDTQPALELRTKLVNALGADHPDLRRADVRITQIKALRAIPSVAGLLWKQATSGDVPMQEWQAALARESR